MNPGNLDTITMVRSFVTNNDVAFDIWIDDIRLIPKS